MKKRHATEPMPTIEDLKLELEQAQARKQYRAKFMRSLRDTVSTILTVSAIAVLVASLLLPVLQIYGTSMTPTLQAGDTVVSVKSKQYKTGDIIAFNVSPSRILVKRVVATPGQWIDIDEAGQVYINGEAIQEPYVDAPARGQCDLEFPYQVPEGQLFVMGDHRSTSLDSRTAAIGGVTSEQIVGKILFRIWPLGGLGPIE